MRKTLVIAACAALLGYVIAALAQPRTDLRPPLVAVASSSSNGTSFAWFYDTAERAVILCRSGSAAGDTLDCKARATLP